MKHGRGETSTHTEFGGRASIRSRGIPTNAGSTPRNCARAVLTPDSRCTGGRACARELAWPSGDPGRASVCDMRTGFGRSPIHVRAEHEEAKGVRDPQQLTRRCSLASSGVSSRPQGQRHVQEGPAHRTRRRNRQQRCSNGAAVSGYARETLAISRVLDWTCDRQHRGHAASTQERRTCQP